MVSDFKIVNDENVGIFAGIISAAFSIAQFTTSVFWGYASDKHGRRKLLMFGLLANSAALITFGLSKTFLAALASRFFSGLLNGNIGICKSVLADVTDRSNRPYAFSLLGLAWGIGSISGPILGGLLADPSSKYPLFKDIQLFVDNKYLLPCLVSSCLGIICFFSTLIFLPETCRHHGNYQYLLEVDDELPEPNREENLDAVQHSVEPVLSTIPSSATPLFLRSAERYTLSSIFNLLRGSSFSTDASNSVVDVFWDAQSEGIEPDDSEQALNTNPEVVRPVTVQTIIGYSLVSLQAVFFEEFFSIWAAAPYKQGLDLSSQDMGLILALMGGLTIFYQLIVFPLIAKYWGSFTIYQWNLILYSVVWFMLPIFVKLYFIGYIQTWFWPLLLLMLAIRRFALVTTSTSISVLITLTALDHQLGLVNGLAQTACSLTRVVGPLVVGFLWSCQAWQHFEFPFDQTLVFIVLLTISIIKVFTGSSHPELNALIIERLGISSSPATVKRFPNAEISVELGVSIRDADVFLIQSGSHSMNDHLMELLLLVAACRASACKRITAVVPYFPYNKQSKKKKARGSISAKLVANMLCLAGVDHIITLELHSSLTQGFFSKPCDNLVGYPILAKYITNNFPLDKCIMVSKNAGGTRRVTQLADFLKIDFSLIHRERHHIRVNNKETNRIETRLTLVGDVKDKICIILDDVIDGTHSYIDTAEHLRKCGAANVHIIAIHGILSDDAVQQIETCDCIDGLIVTNSYPMPREKMAASTKLHIVDISTLLAEAIRRTHNGESMSYLFHTAF